MLDFQKKTLRILRTYWMIFFKRCLNSKISCISKHLKKPSESYSKKVRGNFRKTACPKKHLALKVFICQNISFGFF